MTLKLLQRNQRIRVLWSDVPEEFKEEKKFLWRGHLRDLTSNLRKQCVQFYAGQLIHNLLLRADSNRLRSESCKAQAGKGKENTTKKLRRIHIALKQISS